uniref:Uncharacterized LOC112151873 n=1 Tax=Oryzias melastigma TaxID=30732 RepID=A0A3B3CBX2_ORYME
MFAQSSLYQLAKKWDNLKRRYKELKFPSRGVDTNPNSWPWFYRMNDAMEGRFSGAAPILTPIVEDEDEDCEPLSSTPKKRARRSRGGMTEFLTESEMDLLVDNEDKNGSTALGDFHRLTEFSYKREKMFVKAGMEHLINSDLFFSTMLLRKWEMVERERAALEREREMVERERATVERERAVVQAERLWLDRERAAVERDRAMVEQERLALGRERDLSGVGALRKKEGFQTLRNRYNIWLHRVETGSGFTTDSMRLMTFFSIFSHHFMLDR